MSRPTNESNDKKSNLLINETSPYLLQHAYNPVYWHPWGAEALDKARQEDKPIILSIGYSACHWCHVMERESFESREVALLMNNHFISIKVDREERPDVDQVYMDALQLMNIKGGWPLNIFLTPQAKPFYGGTYFPTSHWIHLLQQIEGAFQNNRKELESSADQFTFSLNQSEIEKYGLLDTERNFEISDLETGVKKMAEQFDPKWGGMDKAPKFPMPCIYLFLLRYHHLSKDEMVLAHIRLTLNRMAMGGIYDQAGGGFARYSTDKEWFVPHFEKMLYDNGQLLSLFSEAYTLTKERLYKDIVEGTIQWLTTEMTSQEGGFYSAIDADSEGEEGKYYVWTLEEVKNLFSEDHELVEEYFDIHSEGNWEHGKNILHVKWSNLAFANKNKLSEEELFTKVKNWKNLFMALRSTKVPPGKDDKIITSWNALMLQGIIDSYKALQDPQILQLALSNAAFIDRKLIDNKEVYHTYKNGKRGVNGFLEDYAFIINSFTSLYQITFDEQWLFKAKELSNYAIQNFYDKEEQMFYFSSSGTEQLIARKKVIFDNVIPSGNSVMATNLLKLGYFFENENFKEIALSMAGRIKKMVPLETGFLGNWASLLTLFVQPVVEVAIIGKDLYKVKEQLDKHYLPNVFYSGTVYNSTLPLLREKSAGTHSDTTLIYVCYNKTCQRPTEIVEEALSLIRKASS